MKKINILFILVALVIMACGENDGVETRTINETIEKTRQIPYEVAYVDTERITRISLELNPIAQYDVLGAPEFRALSMEMVQAFEADAELISFTIYENTLGPRIEYYTESVGSGDLDVIEAITDVNGHLQNGSSVQLFDKDIPSNSIIPEDQGLALMDRIFPEQNDNGIFLELVFDKQFDEVVVLNFIYNIRFKEIQ